MAQWVLWHNPEIKLYLLDHQERFRRFIKLLGFHEVMQVKGKVFEIDDHDIRVTTAKEYFSRDDILKRLVRVADDTDKTFLDLFREEAKNKRRFYQSRTKHDKIVFGDAGMHFLKEDELKFLACPRCKKRYAMPLRRAHFALESGANVRTFGKTCCEVGVYMCNIGTDTEGENKFLISYQGYPGTKKALAEMIKSKRADEEIIQGIFDQYSAECLDSEPIRFYNYIRW